MAYAKQYFVDGEVLTADQLNHMEEGIFRANEAVDHPDIIGENGNWWEWDGEAYVDTGKPSQGGNGGHYTPAVTQPDKNTMKVEFSPSKGDMPAIEPVTVSLPAGPEGAPGKTPESGVDYFTPAEVEAIVAAAVEGVKASEGIYELVEEINTTEELTALRRAEYPDGTPYNFKSMIIKMEIPAGAGTGIVNVTFSDKAGWQLGFSSTNTIATSNRWAWTRIFRDYDRWHCEFSVGSTQYAQAVYRQVGGNEMFGERYGMVGILNIKANTSGVPIPAGTIIKIYGVRA